MSANSGVTTPTMQEQDSTEQEPPSTPQTDAVASSRARNSSINNNPPRSSPSCLSVQLREKTGALIAEIMEQAKNKIFKAFDLGISSEKKKENAQEQQEAEILEKAKNEIYKAFGLVTSSQEQEEDQINTPPDHEADKPSPRNLQLTPEMSSGSMSCPSHPTKRRLKFFEDDDGAQRKKKKIEETVPGAEDEQPFLDLSAYPFLREALKLIEFVKESIPNVIESSKLKELEDKWIDLWEEQMQLSLKLSELILELRKPFSTEAINPPSPKPKGSTG
ncbi:hypothetical protein Pint_35187 [Pistacia integerrima]|uniref:Uncharacterized protein n=1 Tax=Pistacia integerrima TaxID=434235 RepID=A0ACC0Y2L6_9ROSI|nr:hypothetical protein Pint_35187 [Pistacia integerrima]